MRTSAFRRCGYQSCHRFKDLSSVVNRQKHRPLEFHADAFSCISAATIKVRLRPMLVGHKLNGLPLCSSAVFPTRKKHIGRQVHRSAQSSSANARRLCCSHHHLEPEVLLFTTHDPNADARGISRQAGHLHGERLSMVSSQLWKQCAALWPHQPMGLTNAAVKCWTAHKLKLALLV